MKIVFLGLSLSSSWGNGHATTFRALLRELAKRGHDLTFLERDVPWYAEHRDMPACPFADLRFYASLEELRESHRDTISSADAVILGSYVPEGAGVAEWLIENTEGILAFYDIDTPVTLGKLNRGENDYLSPLQVPHFDLYLSFTGGPTLTYLEVRWGARRALPLYCAVDTELYKPIAAQERWALGYLGTYSADRQPTLEELLVAPAQEFGSERFVVAGPQYPEEIPWPSNVERKPHVPPSDHPRFYAAQRFTLNITRREMINAGFSPSVRLFEAASCGIPIISDNWPGLETFFSPGKEILLANTRGDVVTYLKSLANAQREEIGEAARLKVLRHHTAAHRAAELEHHIVECQVGSLKRTGTF